MLLAGLAPGDCPIVSSPLGRAHNTARLLREAGGFTALITLDARLSEISMGAWDGLLLSEIEALRPDFDTRSPPPDWYMRSPDGETYAAFAARLSAWLDGEGHRDGPLIVVTHGVAGRVIRGLYAGLAKDEAISLPVPQDAFYRLSGGVIERIDAMAAA